MLFGSNALSRNQWSCIFVASAVSVGASLIVENSTQASDDKAGESAAKPGRTLTYDDVYGRRPLRSTGSDPSIRGWFDDDHYIESRRGKLLLVNAADGSTSPLPDRDPLRKALASHPDFSEEQASAASRRRFTAESQDRTLAIIQHEQHLYLAAADGSSVKRLTHSKQPRELIRLSPDNAWVAWITDYNLWVVSTLDDSPERALTTDGTTLKRHGKADWVYYEEIFHRDWTAWKWSPDSKRIAYLSFDDSTVDEYLVVDQIPTGQRVERTRYPKVGTTNPTVQLTLVEVAQGTQTPIDLEDYPAPDRLITAWGFNKSGSHVWFTVQNRIQQWLEFHSAPVDSKDSEIVFREDSDSWIHYRQGPRFLTNDTFLWMSDRSGWPHIYEINLAGTQTVALTSGDWEVRKLVTVDDSNENIWFLGTRDSPIAENLYRYHRPSRQIQRVTTASGNHTVRVSPRGRWVIDSHSSVASPGALELLSGESGEQQRVLSTRKRTLPEDLILGKSELVTFNNRSGIELQGLLIYPPKFDSKKTYPVWLKTYGGPHAPTVKDTWNRGRLSDHLLAAHGAFVFYCDPDPASGRGTVSARRAYRQLGVLETQDIADAVQWLCQRPYIDSERFGMSGHSYGGYLTAYVMTHTKLFCAGIAGAPVTDWKNYDTIYTERYMSTPEANPEGYKKSSVVEAAKDLHGRLLIVHGLIDDNVHVSNSLQLVSALQRNNKSFELMIYPQSRHGIRGQHYRDLLHQFRLESLGLTPHDDRPESGVE